MLGPEYVRAFDAARETIRQAIREYLQDNDGYISYLRLVTILVESLRENGDDVYPGMDPSRITQVDHGDYQGTIVFVVGEGGYQPSTYYVTKVYYGSCSGCDTLQSILEGMDRDEDYNRVPGERTIDDLFSLVLHMFQRFQEV